MAKKITGPKIRNLREVQHIAVSVRVPASDVVLPHGPRRKHACVHCAKRAIAVPPALQRRS